MSRPLRHAPPLADRGLLLRPRLLASLRTRFERPLTAVVAAAGFGKTTLLTHAISENALSPLGEDRWLTCQRDDATLSFLAAGVFQAVGLTSPVPDDPDVAAVAVAEAMWSAAPRDIALVLDDAHLIGSGTAGAQFLARLVQELPRTGHLVLASRPPLPLFTSRLLAHGDALVLDERDLQFQDEELASFAASRGVSPDLLSDVGGWPALAELTASAGPHAVTGYVWEEMLSQLSAERRHALAVLVAVGGADEAIATALLGPGVHLERLLDGLPLVVRARSGWWSLHGLWGAALQHHLDAGQVAEARRTAAGVLRSRRAYHDAMGLLLDAGAWDDARDLIVDVCKVFTALVPPDVLHGWLRRLPLDVQSTPEGLLLSAMVVGPTSPREAERLLEQALAGAPATAAARAACLNALVLLAFWRADRHQMASLVDRLQQLASDGHAEARGLIALLRALLASDPAQARAELAAPGLVSGAALSPVQDWLHAHILLRRLGDPAGAQPLARRSMSDTVTTMQAQSRSELLECLRMQGSLAEAEQLLPEMLAKMDSASVLVSPELVTSAVVLLSILGRHEQVADLLHALRPTVVASPVAWAPIALALAEACTAVTHGREQEARTALRDVLRNGVARSRAVVQVSPSALPLMYVLLPEVRPRWDAAPPPGCFGEVLQIARALVDLRDRGSLEATAALALNARRVVRSCLPIPWAAELGVAMVAAGRADGRALVEELGQGARPAMRAASRSPVRVVAAAARTLLREIPAEPDARLQLRVLGPLELLRDGVPVSAPELRRERVRQLLGHLLLHERPTRAGIAAALWPDLDEPAAGRNLRVTLTYLQNVLEPDREEHDPPYFVRSTGTVLQLVTGGALEVDAVEFERLLDEAGASERAGVLSEAATTYLRAVELWTGDYLVDVPDDDELQMERDRLRARFLTAAVRAGNLLLARSDVTGARTLAEKALRADGWCEDAYQLLVAAQLAEGDLANARRTLRRCRLMLTELGVLPQQRTITLERQLSTAR